MCIKILIHPREKKCVIFSWFIVFFFRFVQKICNTKINSAFGMYFCVCLFFFVCVGRSHFDRSELSVLRNKLKELTIRAIIHKTCKQHRYFSFQYCAAVICYVIAKALCFSPMQIVANYK